MGLGISFITFDFLASLLHLPEDWRISDVSVKEGRNILILRIANTPFADGQEIKPDPRQSTGVISGKKYYTGFSWVPLKPNRSKFKVSSDGLCEHCYKPLDDHGADGSCGQE